MRATEREPRAPNDNVGSSGRLKRIQGTEHVNLFFDLYFVTD